MKTYKIGMFGAGLDVKGGITSVEKLILENSSSDVQITHIATFAQGSAIRNLQVYINAFLTLLLKLLARDFDLVHIHFSERGSTLRKLILIPLVLIFRRPLILHSHGATYKEFYEGLPKIVQSLIAAVFRKSAKFVALSDGWKDYYTRAFSLNPEQVAVLKNPVQFPTEAPKRAVRKGTTFLFLGRIGQRGGALDVAASKLPKQDKGAFDLLRAFAAVPADARRSDTKLVLAGNGDVDLARKLVLDLGIQDQVDIYDWLEPAERDDMLKTADAFVLPSYNEGLPMSMLEAMAWELPVIVTPVGGIPEVVVSGENGILVTPGNQSELTNALQSLIEDPDLRLRLGSAAKASVKELDVENYMKALHQLYFSLLPQPDAPVLTSEY
ncbi:MAG: glycosyltransferase family 4 protein [Cyanobacteria bacterium P01_F01_bin.150]